MHRGHTIGNLSHALRDANRSRRKAAALSWVAALDFANHLFILDGIEDTVGAFAPRSLSMNGRRLRTRDKMKR